MKSESARKNWRSLTRKVQFDLFHSHSPCQRRWRCSACPEAQSCLSVHTASTQRVEACKSAVVQGLTWVSPLALPWDPIVLWFLFAGNAYTSPKLPNSTALTQVLDVFGKDQASADGAFIAHSCRIRFLSSLSRSTGLFLISLFDYRWEFCWGQSWHVGQGGRNEYSYSTTYSGAGFSTSSSMGLL